MFCSNCKQLKLSEEFPDQVTELCEHPNTWCFECLIRNLQEAKARNQVLECIDKKCPQKLNQQTLDSLQEQYPFSFLIAEERKTVTRPVFNEYKYLGSNITVYSKSIDGRRTEYNVSPKIQIWDFKKCIESKIGCQPAYQRLVFKKQELKRYLPTLAQPATLSDYGIVDSSEINLIMMMLPVKEEELKKLEFRLSWGYPGKKDYLDGSCIMFSKDKLQPDIIVDYSNTRDLKGATKHSGDKMDDRNRRGSHNITVELNRLDTVDMLFFTLSSWNSKNLGAFGSPQVELVEASAPDDILATYIFEQKSTEQALIMCCLLKGPKGRWFIYQLGKASKGNAKKYDPIIETIKKLIQEDVKKLMTDQTEEDERNTTSS